jgi:protein pelota
MLELMNNEGVKNSMAGLTCFNESKHLDEFFETLRTYDDRACYGIKSVKFAFENPGSVKTLLVSDHLFRSKNSNTRKIYVDLV